MKDKRNIFLIITIVILFFIAISLFYFITKKTDVTTTLQDYFTLISESKYEEMYSKISKDSKRKITKDDFISRNRNIFSGIGVSNIDLTVSSSTKSLDMYTSSCTIKMNTIAGEITSDYRINLIKEDGVLKIIWDSSCIFPNLMNNYKVKVNTSSYPRGKILDRKGNILAADTTALNIGVVPNSLGSNKNDTLSKISLLLGISLEEINLKLNAAYVRDDMFIPLKVISADDPNIEKLKSIPGVMVNNKVSRSYPYGEQAAHLTGYIQIINENELNSLTNKNYNNSSFIGKTGLEKIYEDTLRSYNGYEIVIVNANDELVQSLAKSEGKNGENIKLTIDMDMQSLLFNQIKNDAGTSVASNPKTGEILAMVSSPSYNPNDFVLGISNEKWAELNSNPKHPLVNRFEGKHIPGSVFKPISGAIALESKKLDPLTDKRIKSLNWQKDKSWGRYTITRSNNYRGPSNFKNAMTNSDKIYFAQASLEVGIDYFSSALKSMGFDEVIPFEFGLAKSQFSTSGKLKSEIQLADTSYGQGEVLVNPVHLTSIYSIFINEGNMLAPYILYKETPTPTILKKNVISKDNAIIVTESLKNVISNGTGRGGKVSGLELAGKTGTAEIKNSKDDKNGTELGWFIEMTTGSCNTDLLVVTMIEDVKSKGGSGYVVPLVRKAFETIK